MRRNGDFWSQAHPLLSPVSSNYDLGQMSENHKKLWVFLGIIVLLNVDTSMSLESTTCPAQFKDARIYSSFTSIKQLLLFFQLYHFGTGQKYWETVNGEAVSKWYSASLTTAFYWLRIIKLGWRFPVSTVGTIARWLCSTRTPGRSAGHSLLASLSQGTVEVAAIHDRKEILPLSK